MQNLPALITLIVYSGLLFGIGLWAARRAKSQTDFLLGGRSLGPWVAGLAYAAMLILPNWKIKAIGVGCLLHLATDGGDCIMQGY